MVMVIIAILAAVAIPKFVDLSSQASNAALQGVAGSLSTASAVNYAARKAGNTTGTVAIADCGDVKNALQGGLPTGTNGYTITALPITATQITNATPITCTVTQANGGATASFTAVGIN
jgi:MSHA pilin protein MshA